MSSRIATLLTPCICIIHSILRIIMLAVMMIENILRLLLQTIYNIVSCLLQLCSLIPVILMYLCTTKLACILSCSGCGCMRAGRGGGCGGICLVITVLLLLFYVVDNGLWPKALTWNHYFPQETSDNHNENPTKLFDMVDYIFKANNTEDNLENSNSTDKDARESDYSGSDYSDIEKEKNITDVEPSEPETKYARNETTFKPIIWTNGWRANRKLKRRMQPTGAPSDVVTWPDSTTKLTNMYVVNEPSTLIFKYISVIYPLGWLNKSIEGYNGPKFYAAILSNVTNPYQHKVSRLNSSLPSEVTKREGNFELYPAKLAREAKTEASRLLDWNIQPYNVSKYEENNSITYPLLKSENPKPEEKNYSKSYTRVVPQNRSNTIRSNVTQLLKYNDSQRYSKLLQVTNSPKELSHILSVLYTKVTNEVTNPPDASKINSDLISNVTEHKAANNSKLNTEELTKNITQQHNDAKFYTKFLQGIYKIPDFVNSTLHSKFLRPQKQSESKPYSLMSNIIDPVKYNISNLIPIPNRHNFTKLFPWFEW